MKKTNSERQSDLGDLGCLKALRALLNLIFDLISLIKGLETIRLNSRIVDEDIFPAIVGVDESVTLASAEEFHSALCHN